MHIAPYYQKLLELGVKATRSLEPITFCGMYDAGVDYLFNLSIPLFSSELEQEIRLVMLDLSGLSSEHMVLEEISDTLGCEPTRHAIIHDIQTLTKEKPVVWVMYLGQEGNTDGSLFLLLNRLRNLLGWRFSYCLFATTRQLRNAMPITEKVLKRNLVPVVPLDEASALIVFANYEERYKKTVSEKTRRVILKYAGGNPGLIKALYLQAFDHRWLSPDILEEQLYFRLHGIAKDITDVKRGDPMTDYFLLRYGYMIKHGSRHMHFTSLLSDYISTYKKTAPKVTKVPDNKLLLLTKSQRTLLEHLEKHSGELVSKDDIAKVLWGELWTEKYSDWAIDQLISTLREKLKSTILSGSIVTKKGEGIIYLKK